MKQNIYEILQVKEGRWIIIQPEDELRKGLLNSHVMMHFKTHEAWVKGYSKPARAAHASSFNTSIFGWLKKEYAEWQYEYAYFEHSDSVVGITDATSGISQRAGELYNHHCKVNCCNNKCSNRKIYLECSDSCTSSTCYNKESRQKFDWRKIMLVTLINKDKGIGVIAKEDLSAGFYLGQKRVQTA